MRRALILAAALLLPAAAGAQTYATEWLTASTRTANRINVAILGDGYTADATSQAKLTTDANAVLARLFSTAPWSDVKPLFTVKLVHVVSAQSGATNGIAGGTRSTALGSYFGCNGTDRLICLSTSKALTIAAQHFPEYSFVFVIVNDAKYGGSGGTVATVSTHTSAPYILIHELGHSIAHLADEYTSAYPGYPTCSSTTDCPEANATLRTDRTRVKWATWVDAATPVPTPTASGFTATGVFEGARYFTTGVYRPKETGCIMRSSSTSYCSPCREAILSYALSYVDVVDAASPSTATVSVNNCSTRAFSVTPVPMAGTGTFTYRWTVNGAVQAATGPSLTLPAGFTTGTHAIAATVRYASPSIRNDPAAATAATVSWTANVSACSTTTTPTTPVPAVAITPGSVTVLTGGTQAFAATGGSGTGFVWSVSTNSSGGRVDAYGRYTAGAIAGVDLLRVVDSLGNSAMASVNVTAPTTTTPTTPTTAPVALSPSSATVLRGASRTFAASGGSGSGYRWTISTNRSGGSIDASGRYTAGWKFNVTDVVRVTDSAGRSASASVAVVRR